MNPNLTANLRAEAELRAEIEQQTVGWQKEFIGDALSVALPNLQAAHDVAKHLAPTHSDLYTAICDALNSCNAALEHISDAPDDLYDVAVNHLDAIEIGDDFEF